MATYSNIYIDQGSTYSSVIDVKDSNGLSFNLTGYLSRGQIRKSYSSSGAVPFATAINAPLEGKVTLSLTSAQTRNMKSGRYVYDVEIYNDGGHVIRVAEGQVEINPGITDNNGGIILPPAQTLSGIIDEKIDTRTVIVDRLLPLTVEEEQRFYSNIKLDEKLALKAPLASPTFTGTPLSTTPAVNTNTTQIATTAFVVGQASASMPVMNGTAAIGTSLRYARADHVHPVDTTRAPLASPTFTGAPLAPNPLISSNDTRIATTKFVNDKLTSFAPLASPTFTGTPLAPNPLVSSNDTQIATTSFVVNSFSTAVNNYSNQTITGIKTFSDQIILENSQNQMILRNGTTGNSILITVPATITANRTITIPDVGASGAVVLNVGPQNISGIKTFTTSPVVPTPTTSSQAASKGYVDSIIRVLNVTGRISNISTTETDIHSYTLPIGVLANNGESVEIELFGSTANNANNKQFRFYFGGTQYIDFGNLTLQAVDWIVKIKIQRGGISGGTGYMKILGILDYGTGKVIKTIETPNTTIDSTTTIATRISATGTANGDIVSLAGKTVWTQAPQA